MGKPQVKKKNPANETTIKLLLLMFNIVSAGCDSFINTDDYYALIGHTNIKNRQQMRESVNYLKNIKLVYKNTPPIYLFEEIKYHSKLIEFQFCGEVKSLLSKRGKGHKAIEIPREIYIRKDSRKYKYNIVKFILMLYLYTLSQYNIISVVDLLKLTGLYDIKSDDVNRDVLKPIEDALKELVYENIISGYSITENSTSKYKHRRDIRRQNINFYGLYRPE